MYAWPAFGFQQYEKGKRCEIVRGSEINCVLCNIAGWLPVAEEVMDKSLLMKRYGELRDHLVQQIAKAELKSMRMSEQQHKKKEVLDSNLKIGHAVYFAVKATIQVTTTMYEDEEYVDGRVTCRRLAAYAEMIAAYSGRGCHILNVLNADSSISAACFELPGTDIGKAIGGDWQDFLGRALAARADDRCSKVLQVAREDLFKST